MAGWRSPAREAPPSTAVRLVRIAHRLAATSVLALVIGMLLVAWTQKPAWKREGGLALAALFVAAALAVLGLATPGAKFPAVTLGNLLGGYLMLALLSATAALARSSDDDRPRCRHRPRQARARSPAPCSCSSSCRPLRVRLIGAQYALTACPALARVPGLFVRRPSRGGALDPFRALSIVEGHVVPPAGAAGLHVSIARWASPRSSRRSLWPTACAASTGARPCCWSRSPPSPRSWAWPRSRTCRRCR